MRQTTSSCKQSEKSENGIAWSCWRSCVKLRQARQAAATRGWSERSDRTNRSAVSGIERRGTIGLLSTGAMLSGEACTPLALKTGEESESLWWHDQSVINTNARHFGAVHTSTSLAIP